jgi:putative ATPase
LNTPLLSRCLLLRLEPLTGDDVRAIVRNSLADEARGLGLLGLRLADDALEHLVTIAGGDARVALTGLEAAALAAKVAGETEITLDLTADAVQRKAVVYDRQGDAHYDVISAFIKSIRGSDADAALFWLARMIEAGEDPRFIARRLIVHASEDIGMADSRALLVAVAAAHAVEHVGLPEARLNLAHATIYLARAPKSNSVYTAISEALNDAVSADPVPTHLRDASYPGARKLGHGKGYRYPHDFPDHHVDQAYRPERFEEATYYEPSGMGEDTTEWAPGAGSERSRPRSGGFEGDQGDG